MSTIINPLVSVIVPIYNVEKYLDACLDSIKNQTYINLEIIVVEDGSTDRSKSILTSHLDDQRMRVIEHSKNSGLSAARNTGIQEATGEYIMFVDSDDIIDTRLIKACVDCAHETDAEVITYDFVPFEDGAKDTNLPYAQDDLVFKQSIDDNAYFSRPHFAWLKFIRTSVIRSASLTFPVDLYYEDWPFHWHLGLVTTNRYHLPVAFYLYRQRQTSITGSAGKKLLDIFVVQSQVAELLQHDESDDIKKRFASKVYESYWFVLTRIDTEHLTTALRAAKALARTYGLNQYKADMPIREVIISKIVRAPRHLDLLSLKVLRKALHQRVKFKS